MSKRELIPFPTDTSAYRAAAIHTTLEPARMAWYLDDRFRSAFWLLPIPLQIESKAGTTEHHVFYHSGDSDECRFWLISVNGTLYQSKPRPDYLLVLKGETADSQLDEWISGIMGLPSVSLAYKLDAAGMKQLHWLTWLGALDDTDKGFEPEDN